MGKNSKSSVELPTCYICHKPIKTDLIRYHDKQTGLKAHIECIVDTMEDDENDTVRQCNHIIGLSSDKGVRLVTVNDFEIESNGDHLNLKIEQEFKYCPTCGKKL